MRPLISHSLSNIFLTTGLETPYSDISPALGRSHTLSLVLCPSWTKAIAFPFCTVACNAVGHSVYLISILTIAWGPCSSNSKGGVSISHVCRQGAQESQRRSSTIFSSLYSHSLYSDRQKPCKVAFVGRGLRNTSHLILRCALDCFLCCHRVLQMTLFPNNNFLSMWVFSLLG